VLSRQIFEKNPEKRKKPTPPKSEKPVILITGP
jgi:hypothetical protein